MVRVAAEIPSVRDVLFFHVSPYTVKNNMFDGVELSDRAYFFAVPSKPVIVLIIDIYV